MNYAVEKNHISEDIEVWDEQGLQYHLEVTHTFNKNQTIFSAIINLVRNKRNTTVGNANLVFNSLSEAMIGDLIIYQEVPFSTLNDKFYRLLNWTEPTNYQKRGLGTILLKYIIDLAFLKGVETLSGSLTKDDIKSNPNLVNWYKKHGFAIESPTKDEVSSAVHRACLYFK
jgi:hypothetical protein